MADDQQALKVFLRSTRDRAEGVLGGAHIGADVKELIRDLLQIANNAEDLISHSSGQSADTRVLKKKLDQSKTETRAAEAKIESAKKLILSLVDEIKAIHIETAGILKRHAADMTDAGAVSATRIKTAIQKMTEIIVKSSDK